MTVTLIHGDCLEILPTLEAGSVDAVVTDPPYFKVKNEPWDRQWDTAAGFLSWLDGVLVEFQRILKPNGSLYLFASPRMAARVECKIAERFAVLNRITWRKPPYSTKAEMFDKDTMRAFFPASEAIIFAEHGNSDRQADELAGFTRAEIELKKRIFGDYLTAEWKRAGVNYHEITGAIGAYREKNHGGAASNWALGYNCPTPEQYQAMREYLNNKNGSEYLRTEYEDLRTEYEDLRTEYEDLRRPFNVTAEMPYTDVWDFETVNTYPGKHPCEKPIPLMEHIIVSSSRPGDVVIDPFMGAGTTGLAAQNLGREFIGIDQSAKWYRRAQDRLTLPLFEGLL